MHLISVSLVMFVCLTIRSSANTIIQRPSKDLPSSTISNTNKDEFRSNNFRTIPAAIQNVTNDILFPQSTDPNFFYHQAPMQFNNDEHDYNFYQATRQRPIDNAFYSLHLAHPDQTQPQSGYSGSDESQASLSGSNGTPAPVELVMLQPFDSDSHGRPDRQQDFEKFALKNLDVERIFKQFQPNPNKRNRPKRRQPPAVLQQDILVSNPRVRIPSQVEPSNLVPMNQTAENVLPLVAKELKALQARSKARLKPNRRPEVDLGALKQANFHKDDIKNNTREQQVGKPKNEIDKLLTQLKSMELNDMEKANNVDEIDLDADLFDPEDAAEVRRLKNVDRVIPTSHLFGGSVGLVNAAKFGAAGHLAKMNDQFNDNPATQVQISGSKPDNQGLLRSLVELMDRSNASLTPLMKKDKQTQPLELNSSHANQGLKPEVDQMTGQVKHGAQDENSRSKRIGTEGQSIPIELLVDHLMSNSRLASFGIQHKDSPGPVEDPASQLGDEDDDEHQEDDDEDDEDGSDQDESNDDRDNNNTLPPEANMETSESALVSSQSRIPMASLAAIKNESSSWVPLGEITSLKTALAAQDRDTAETKGVAGSRKKKHAKNKKKGRKRRRKRGKKTTESHWVIGDKKISRTDLIRLIKMLNKYASSPKASEEREVSRKMLRFLIRLALTEYKRNKASGKLDQGAKVAKSESKLNDTMKDDDIVGDLLKSISLGDEEDEGGGGRKIGESERLVMKGRRSNANLGGDSANSRPASSKVKAPEKSLNEQSQDLEQYFESDFFEELADKLPPAKDKVTAAVVSTKTNQERPQGGATAQPVTTAIQSQRWSPMLGSFEPRAETWIPETVYGRKQLEAADEEDVELDYVRLFGQPKRAAAADHMRGRRMQANYSRQRGRRQKPSVPAPDWQWKPSRGRINLRGKPSKRRSLQNSNTAGEARWKPAAETSIRTQRGRRRKFGGAKQHRAASDDDEAEIDEDEVAEVERRRPSESKEAAVEEDPDSEADPEDGYEEEDATSGDSNPTSKEPSEDDQEDNERDSLAEKSKVELKSNELRPDDHSNSKMGKLSQAKRPKRRRRRRKKAMNSKQVNNRRTSNPPIKLDNQKPSKESEAPQRDEIPAPIFKGPISGASYVAPKKSMSPILKAKSIQRAKQGPTDLAGNKLSQEKVDAGAKKQAISDGKSNKLDVKDSKQTVGQRRRRNNLSQAPAKNGNRLPKTTRRKVKSMGQSRHKNFPRNGNSSVIREQDDIDSEAEQYGEAPEESDGDYHNEGTSFSQVCDDDGGCKMSVKSNSPTLSRAIQSKDQPTIDKHLDKWIKN